MISIPFRNVDLRKLIAEIGWRNQEIPLWARGMLAKGEGGKCTCMCSPRGTVTATTSLK